MTFGTHALWFATVTTLFYHLCAFLLPAWPLELFEFITSAHNRLQLWHALSSWDWSVSTVRARVWGSFDHHWCVILEWCLEHNRCFVFVEWIHACVKMKQTHVEREEGKQCQKSSPSNLDKFVLHLKWSRKVSACLGGLRLSVTKSSNTSAKSCHRQIIQVGLNINCHCSGAFLSKPGHFVQPVVLWALLEALSRCLCLSSQPVSWPRQCCLMTGSR